MTNLSKLRAAIIEAVPEIMRLSKGCKVKYDNAIWDFSDHFINGKAPLHRETEGYIIIRHGMGWDGRYCDTHTVYTISDGVEQENKDIEILGRPITLADVLRAIEQKRKRLSLGELAPLLTGWVKNPKEKWDDNPKSFVAPLWDLTKNLDDQSPETIDFLTSVLCKD